MVKVDKNIANGQNLAPKKITLFQRFLVTILLMLGVFVLAFSVTYLRKIFVFNAPVNFQECAKLKSSTIQESYPAVCVTKDGQRFIQPLSEQEQKLLESPLKITEKPKTGKFCGGIAGIPCDLGYKCELEGDYPDAGGKCIKE